MPKLCSVEDCQGEARTRGWCNKHYARWQRLGTVVAPKVDHRKDCSLEGCDRQFYAKGVCSMHYDRMRISGSYEPLQATIRDTATDTHKMCSRCLKMKPYEEFNRFHQGFKGRTAYCKACIKETYTPEVAQRKRLTRALRKYGPEAEGLIQRIDSGEGCEVCGSLIRLSIDHCHDSGKIRGILCGPCNSSLGYAKDDAERLRKLATYVESHQGLQAA